MTKSEYLVSMTTRVPEGTSAGEVDDVRAREAAHSGELAAQGSLLRLWRPPLEPGEWRTLGLFAAPNDAELEEVLESMPLRVWRSDDVTPLMPHANDPDPNAGTGPRRAEFLTTFVTTVPAGTSVEDEQDRYAQEGVAARRLAAEGQLRRLWKLPGDRRALGLWEARDADQLQEILTSLPLAPWMTVETVPLSPHPNDPAYGPAG